MNNHQNVTTNKLAQSASALGAALLGFGIGAKWGANTHTSVLMAIIIVGSIIHVGGMYVVQLKDSVRSNRIARLLWIAAWICLLSVIGLILFLILAK